MINQQLKNYLSSQPLKTILRTLVGLLKEVTGLRALVITVDNDNKITVLGSSGIITNEETVSVLHDYFCDIENNFLREEIERQLKTIVIKVKDIDDISN